MGVEFFLGGILEPNTNIYGLERVVQANMDGVETKMDGAEAKMEDMEEKMKDNMENMKNDLKANMEGLTNLIQEIIPNGEKIVEETHDDGEC